MGYYRLILALLVVSSHCGIFFFGKNQGVMAVVSFFIISGYVITKLINKNYHSKNEIRYFYLDRILRLFPQFLFYLICTCAVYVLFGDAHSLHGMINVILNSLMLPLNFFVKNNIDHIIVPQSWSLGLEMQFYLLVPFVLLFNKHKQAIALSLVAFLPAYLGLINTDFFGYRMLSGVLFIFLMGSCLAKNDRPTLIICYSLCIVAFFFVTQSNKLQHVWNYEVLSGVIIGLPIIIILLKLNHRSKHDNIMGNISYGVYLNHFLVKYLLEKFGINSHSLTYVIMVVSFSVIISYVSYLLVEKPVYSLRHIIRRRHAEF